MSRIATLIICSILSLAVWASEPLVFESPEQEARYTTLTQELRCLVCQNQSLADSDAPLAQDLRQEIHKMLQGGRSNEEIKTFLVERYGDFVLYRPPVKGSTLVLWLLPLILLAGGGIIVTMIVRRQMKRPEGTPAEME
jgi:cytochrome c-type biogenesis protein CcmH